MKKIITAIILAAISTNLVYATDLSQYPKATSNGQTTQTQAPIVKEAPKKKKSSIAKGIGKTLLFGLGGGLGIVLLGVAIGSSIAEANRGPRLRNRKTYVYKRFKR